MNSSNSSHRPKASRAHPTPSFLLILDDGTRHRVSDRDFARQFRQERTATLKRLRQSRAEGLAAVADKLEDARIRREFKTAERALDASLRRFWKRVKIQPEPRRNASKPRTKNSKSGRTGHNGLVLKVRSQASSALKWCAKPPLWHNNSAASVHPIKSSTACSRPHRRCRAGCRQRPTDAVQVLAVSALPLIHLVFPLFIQGANGNEFFMRKRRSGRDQRVM